MAPREGRTGPAERSDTATEAVESAQTYIGRAGAECAVRHSLHPSHLARVIVYIYLGDRWAPLLGSPDHTPPPRALQSA